MKLLLILSLLTATACAISTKIEAETEECFSSTVRHGSQASFSFVVTAGGQQEVDVRLFSRDLRIREGSGIEKEMSPSGRRSLDSIQGASSLSSNYEISTRDLRQWTRATSGSHSHTVPHNAIGSDHEVVACISNKHSRWTPKWVSFQFTHMDVDNTQVNEMGYTPEEVERERRAHASAQKIYRIQQDIEKVKSVELEHRNTVESTNAWLGYGSLVNCLLLIGMSIFQYWYLTHFLAVRHASTRM